MNEEIKEFNLNKVWVEIQEQSDESRIVFKCISSDVPRSRAPRRRLDLEKKDRADTYEGGPSDRIEHSEEGTWTHDGKTLELTIDGWEGKYEIEELTEDSLILKLL